MSFKITGRKTGDHLGPGSIAEHGSHGGLLATVVSAIALVMSGLSYYETSLKTAELQVYVPPMIHYARDGRDVFNIPITIANDGARTGTVLTMELDVENLGPNPEGLKKRKFHAAFIGEYPSGKDNTNASIGRSFAPLAIAGHSTFTETVRFYPTDDNDAVLITDKGDYRFTLTLLTAKSGRPDIVEAAFRTDPKPVTFDLNLPYLAIQHLAFRNGTQAMFSKSWKAAQSESTDSAVSRSAPSASEPPSEEAKPAEPAPAPPAPPPAAQPPVQKPPAQKK